MSDESLRIRVDVDTAPIKALADETKRFMDIFKSAAPGSEQFTTAAANINTLKDRTKELTSEVVKNRDAYFNIGTTLRQVGQIAVEAFAIFSSFKLAEDMAMTASRIEIISKYLTEIGQQKNFNAPELMSRLEAATGGAVSKMDLLQIALRAVQLGNIDLNKLPDIMAHLQDRAILTGQSVKDLALEFFKAGELGKERLQVQFGLLFDVGKAEEEYAKKLGTSVQFLSQSEKETAHLQAATEELLKTRRLDNDASKESVENIEKVNVGIERIKTAVGDLIASPLGKTLSTMILGLASAAEVAVLAVQSVGLGWATTNKDLSVTIAKIKEIGEEIKKTWGAGGGTTPSPTTPIAPSPVIPPHEKTEKELAANEKSHEKYLKDVKEMNKELADINDQMTLAEIEAEASVTKQNLDQEDMRFANQLKYWNAARKDFPEMADEINKAIENLTIAHNNKMNEIAFPTGGGKEGKATPFEVTKEWQTGIDVLNTGFDTLAGTINNGIVNALGNAHSMFQQFLAGVLEGIASIAERLASAAIISGIFSLFGGGPFGAMFGKLSGFAQGGVLTEPVVGFGASGRAYSFAENAPERFSPLTSMAGSGGGTQAIHITGEFKQSGRDMVAVIKEARVIDRKKGGNF